MYDLLESEAGTFGCAIEACPLHETSYNACLKAVIGNAKSAVQGGNSGYADWEIVSIHGLRTYLDLPYRRLLDVLHELPRIGRILGLEMSQLPDFTTVCARIQTFKIPL